MAHTKSTIKRIRQSEKSRKRNSGIKSSLRTAAKKVVKMISSSTDPQEIKENLKQFAKRIDTATRKGVIHKKAASRKKSRLARRANKVATKSS